MTGTETTLETPTAVAAIRGTQGTQEVPNDNQSTHALNEGVEQITEVVTQQSVTINSGQRVTAIRGIGFTPIVALVAAITQPSVTAGGAAGGGAGAGAATATSATVSTVVTVAAVATAGAAVTAGVLGPALANGTPPAASASQP